LSSDCFDIATLADATSRLSKGFGIIWVSEQAAHGLFKGGFILDGDEQTINAVSDYRGWSAARAVG
jgi:hypothetical protein